MYGAGGQPKRYEEHAVVLDVRPHSRSTTVRGREGTMVTALGEGKFTILEVLAAPDASLRPGDRICIGKEGRTNVEAVLGRIPYPDASPAARAELRGAVEAVVRGREDWFVEYVNTAGQLTQRTHALEMIPGIGRMHMKAIVEEREKRRFGSYRDLEMRVDLEDPAARIAERIMDEITGEERTCLFTKR